MQSLITRVPPSRPDVEKNILGTLIVEPSSIDTIKDILEPSSFYVTKHAEIYSTMLKMRESGIEIDIVTLPEYIVKNGCNADYDTSLYIAELCENIGSIRSLPEYVKIVNEKAIVRKIIAKNTAVIQQCYSENYQIDNILSQIENLSVDIGSSCDKAKINRRKSGQIVKVSELRDRMFEYRKSGLKGIVAPVYSLHELFPLLSKHVKFATGMLNVFTGIPGMGKALCVKTIIPTPHGNKTMEELKAGDQVFDENGMVCNVVKTTETMYGRPCFKMTFNDGSSVICDAEHQWFTSTELDRRSKRQTIKKNRLKELRLRGTDQTYKRKKPSVKTTMEISKTIVESGKTNHQIKTCEPVRYPEKKLLIHPYVLGAWLGDGSSHYAGITCNDIEIVEKINSLGYPIKKWTAKYLYGIGNLTLKLKELNLLKNKHIPNEYLLSSVDQRIELLKGLLDTDGYCEKGGHVEFCSTNYEIAKSVDFLCKSLGITSRLTTGNATLNGRVISKKYRVMFYTDLEVFFLKRKQFRNVPKKIRKYRSVVKCEPVESVPVKCIQVDSNSHLYLCTESFIPTHNSEMHDQIQIAMSQLHGWKWGVFSPENYPYERHVQKLIEKLIGKNFFSTNEAELECAIDFVDNHFFWIEPDEENINIENLLNMNLQCKKDHGIKGIIWDPWNEIEMNPKAHEKETDYIGRMLGKIRRHARRHDYMMDIIAHPTKIQKDLKTKRYLVPTLYDINGSANWYNKTDNGFCTYRYFGSPQPVPNVEFHIQKIKFKIHGEVGVVQFNYDKESGRLIEHNTYQEEMEF